ncbi:MAG: hypothetical protein GY754_27900 [bacterium]|nr:hypothetical protein [bacterium]
MTKFNTITKNIIQDPKLIEETDDFFCLDSNKTEKDQILALTRLLESKKDLNKVVLIIDNALEGVVERKNILPGSTPKFLDGGIGGAGGAALPGDHPENISFLEYHCKEPDCKKIISLTFYDRHNPPKCPAHNSDMELQI